MHQYNSADEVGKRTLNVLLMQCSQEITLLSLKEGTEPKNALLALLRQCQQSETYMWAAGAPHCGRSLGRQRGMTRGGGGEFDVPSFVLLDITLVMLIIFYSKE